MPNYLFALNQSNELIHINQVDKSIRGKFTCLHCKNEMISRLGEIRVHHFAHKSERNCSYESYLHRTAKQVFLEKYSYCLSYGMPFYLEQAIERECTTCEDFKYLRRKCKLASKIKRNDLTQYFEIIEVEKMHQGFIADVLLRSSKHSHVLFIEFSVTHNCEEEKVNSGLRIIEVQLESEACLEFISERKFSLKNPILKRHNFKFAEEVAMHIQRSKCSKSLRLFTISKDGRANMQTLPMSRLDLELTKDNYLRIEVFKNDKGFDSLGREYIRLVKDCSLEGDQVKNCFACKFSVSNSNLNIDENTFCKKLKEGVANSNDAADCKFFWRIDGTEKEVDQWDYHNMMSTTSRGVKSPSQLGRSNNEYYKMKKYRGG